MLPVDIPGVVSTVLEFAGELTHEVLPASPDIKGLCCHIELRLMEFDRHFGVVYKDLNESEVP